jgi:hypothetical protein
MTTTASETYLGGIEELAEGSEYESLYLWPRTPLTPDHQEIIERRVGVNDYQVDDPRSRSAMIIKKLRELVGDSTSPLGERFSLVDLACGDAVVLWQVQKAFPNASCYGVDCNRGLFTTNESATQAGVGLYKGYLQHVFTRDPDTPFDMTLMLNTYRGWESADLRDEEKELPLQADDWFGRNSRYVIVTAVPAQIKRLRREGWWVEELGKGEDASTMICMSRLERGGIARQVASRLKGWLG